MHKHEKFGGFSKEERGFCPMVASAGWKTGWVGVGGGQNAVWTLGWQQSMLGISNTAASTRSPTAAPGHGAAPSPWTPPSLPKEICSRSTTLRASRESTLRRGTVLWAVAQGRIWGWVIGDETTLTNSPPPVPLRVGTRSPTKATPEPNASHRGWGRGDIASPGAPPPLRTIFNLCGFKCCLQTLTPPRDAHLPAPEHFQPHTSLLLGGGGDAKGVI